MGKGLEVPVPPPCKPERVLSIPAVVVVVVVAVVVVAVVVVDTGPDTISLLDPAMVAAIVVAAVAIDTEVRNIDAEVMDVVWVVADCGPNGPVVAVVAVDLDSGNPSSPNGPVVLPARASETLCTIAVAMSGANRLRYWTGSRSM